MVGSSETKRGGLKDGRTSHACNGSHNVARARWIYGSGHPDEWSSQDVDTRSGGNIVTIVLEQTQSGVTFLDPVPVTITSEGKTTRLTLYPKSKPATARVRTGRVPLDIQIDPDDTLLKELVSGQMVN